MPLLRFVLFFIFLLITTGTYAQKEQKKDWDKAIPLQWTDFKAPIVDSSRFDACTYSCVDFTYNWHEQDGVYNLTFDVKSTMSRDRSWIRIEKQSPQLLRHEQVHFDIAEFFARQLRVALNNYSYTSNYKNEVTEIEHQIIERREAMQKMYDEQTNHSLNKVMQSKWEDYLSNLLNANYTFEQALKQKPKKDNVLLDN